ncbi:HWE histidine kinase domain-containing protein [Sphingomonas sp. PB2P19]|uniref:HWE histidine kinase domain-containing protein n=1 Tax=Sphingomonas rhamnosi TaxID=3096156 RepID=UPI002FCA8A08
MTSIKAVPERTTPSSDPEQPLSADAQLTALMHEVQSLHRALAAAEVRERALTYELQHRVRNMLAVIRTIYRRMLASKTAQDQFAFHFEDRLDAIGRYQTDIAGVSAGGIELEDMVRDELLTVHCTDGPDCTITGPSVRLSAKWVELMGLALHELAINAVKFGALCHGGALRIEWWLTEEAGQSMLHFHWKETGVALLTTAPRPRGFGQDLIEEALPYQFGATTSFEFKPGGLECSIVLPLPTQVEPMAFLPIERSSLLNGGGLNADLD